MKILLVRTSSAENTIFKNIYNEQEVGLAKQLTKLGCECGIVYYSKKGNGSTQEILMENKKIKIYNLEGKDFCKSALYKKEIYDLCEQYDIIQVYECDKVMSWLIYSKYPNKTIIYHGPYKSKFTWKHNLYAKIFYKIFLHKKNFCNAYIITKSLLAEDFLKKQGFKNVHTIGVGLDTEKFEKQQEKNITIENLINQKEKHSLQFMLYIGKMEDRRNITFLIDILENVIKKNKNVKLILVGKGNQEYVNKCFKYAKEKNIFENIIYIESIPQQELPELYKNCEVFLLPTQYEIFGMVLLEAMYFGIPTITTLNGGSSTIIKNQENGIICSLNNLEEWTDSVNKILNDSDFRKRIIENSRKQIIKNYTWDILADKFLSIYKDLLS